MSAAVIGTVAVYIGAPLVRPLIDTPAPEGAQAASRHPTPPPAPPPVAPPVAPDPVTPGLPGASSLSARPGTSDDEMAPALHGIFLAQRGETPAWGVTRRQTTPFTPEGTRLTPLPGGTLFHYRGTRDSSKGPLVACVLDGNQAAAPQHLLEKAAVLLFTGSYTSLSPRQRTALQTFYALNGNILQRKNDLLQIAAAQNPHFPAYQRAYKRLMENIDTAKALAAKRDALTGMLKTRAEEQLRELKTEQTRLRAAYDAIHARFRDWKRAHAHTLPVLDQDPAVQAWRAQMETCRAAIAGLAYDSAP